MSKIKKIMAGLLALVAAISLASCNKSGLEVEFLNSIITSNSIKINMAFGNYSILENGGSVYVKKDGSTSTSDYKTLEFNNDYSKSSCTYTGLNPETEYTFVVYLSLNDKDEEIGKQTYKTRSASSEDFNEISTKDDLLNIDDSDTKLNYILVDNIDLDGSEILLFDSSSSPYEGIFDGNGYEISNFKLKSSSGSGLFGYTSGATIKNLKISNVSYYSTSLRSTLNMGALVGNAIDTKFEDITVDNVLYGKRNAENQLSASTSSELKMGGVVGYANNSSFSNVNASNISILMTKARKFVSMGLFAGYLDGNKYDKDDFAVKNSSASGEIYANCEYSSSNGYTRIGGFIGTLGTTGKVVDSYSDVEIAYTRRNGTGYVNHSLYIGGFIGTSYNSQIKVENCVSVADIVAYAGQKSDLHESADDLTSEEAKTNVYDNMIATKAYIGGFAGDLTNLISSVDKCVYAPRVDGIVVYGSKLSIVENSSTSGSEGDSSDENTPSEYLYVGLFYGDCQATSKVKNSGYTKANKLAIKYSYTEEINDTKTTDVTDSLESFNLGEALLKVLNGSYVKKNTIDATAIIENN